MWGWCRTSTRQHEVLYADGELRRYTLDDEEWVPWNICLKSTPFRFLLAHTTILPQAKLPSCKEEKIVMSALVPRSISTSSNPIQLSQARFQNISYLKREDASRWAGKSNCNHQN